MKAKDVTTQPGYLDAKRKTMEAILGNARSFSTKAVEAYVEIDPVDLLRDPHLGYAALDTPASEWHAAMGQLRPQSRWNIIGRVRFRLAVRRAKREIQASIDRYITGMHRRAHSE